MMTNLFILFDPMTNIFNFQLNWLFMLIFFLFIPLNYWLFKNQYNFFINWIFNKLYQEFKNLLNSNYENLSMFIMMFMFLLMNNFISMFPYIFTPSSHLSFTISMSLSFWLSFMIFGWIFKSFQMFFHMIPENTPYMLMSFMTLIETTSNIIRPMTLAIRLMANMIAGHLLLTLLSNSYNFLNYFIYLLIFIQILLLTLEFTVSIIQAYVFSTLTLLYFKEIT